MKIVTLEGTAFSSQILIDESIANVLSYIGYSDAFVITDENVHKIYGDKFPHYPVYEVKSGEKSKSFQNIVPIYQWLLNEGAGRHSFILGIGGGVVCDIAGFVASTYMRGIKFGFVATTLLAQVDASVGGKNGIDLDGYKNIVGTFNQPKFVLCDTSMLQTLPYSELANGFAEMVKHSIIESTVQFKYFEKHVESLLNNDADVLSKLVQDSVELKASVVSADEHERGNRKILNLGHTWGHAVEKLTGLPHGRCVSIGIEFAARISKSICNLSQSDYLRICSLLQALALPTHTTIDPRIVFDALTMDKKKCGDAVDFVCIKRIGEVEIRRIKFSELMQLVL